MITSSTPVFQRRHRFASLALSCFALFVCVSEVAKGEFTVLPPFDPTVPQAVDDDGEPFGDMDTSFDAASADGKVIVGHAQEYVSIVELPPDEVGKY